ncbi:hypothetical protein [Mangrovibacterium diazotrophicum]|uniref:Uncharacterized protein n=1 Tax=Mangrovibacterium diazotrophicum TaxID=1261403 RepID=A0A419W5G0_9BACT|nr:hypothetical protein [Mangrovibacterium diazotrophicum]RKD90675.1 hypothetical protein BC643_1016 [Mangrovibacterium diazotrophicum]
MIYLKAALELKQLIRKVNHLQIQKESTVLDHKNSMFLFTGGKLLAEKAMDEYSNDFVLATLAKYPEATSFVMTDLATTDLKDRKLTYWLYKGYHVGLDKGMVYYQPIEEQNLRKVGRIQFSNLETNIFLLHQAPDFEESSANAMETDEEIEGGKAIVFLVGNMNETRLLYDIQRLIFDSANNVQNHKSLSFKFILNVSKFGGKSSDDFKKKLNEIELFTRDKVAAEYANARFVFDLEN